MPTSELHASRRHDAHAEYCYRRRLGVRETLPAVGAAIAAGMLAFYIMRLLLQRTPLRVDRGPRAMSASSALTRGGRTRRARPDHPAA